MHGANVSNRVRGRLVAPSKHRSAFAVPLDVREPGTRELLVDRTLGAPGRHVRDHSRALARRAGLQLLGKEGYASAKAALRTSRARVLGRSPK